MATTMGLYLMKQFMETSVPDTVLESARLDGASEFRTFLIIAMPMVKPAWLTLMIECFKTLENYFQINEDWECFWPQSGSSMNWDAIFTIDDTWFFVEAKAHIGEAFQKCSATSERSIETIEKAFDETKNWLGISKNDMRWIKTDCYQLANRLAFMRFCTKNGIKAKLLYISFVNGYYRKSVTSRELWETKVWDKQYEALGITQDSVKDLIYHIYPNCEPDNR